MLKKFPTKSLVAIDFSYLFFVFISLSLFSGNTLATPATNQDNKIRLSKSISYSSSDKPSKIMRDEKLKNGKLDINSSLKKFGYRTESGAVATTKSARTLYAKHDIGVYDAWSELIYDDNDNGYYYRFSVGVDVDTIFKVSYVYAKLYLSYEGGPWNHYATSDDYHIYGEKDDELIIESELDDGYDSGYYDIKIEIYNADNNEWLDSYGPNEDDDLADLPLEDSYNDERYNNSGHIHTNVSIVGHGGLNMWLLLLVAFIFTLRWFTIQQQNTLKSIKIRHQNHKK